jgi:hypothetical protein
MNTFPGRADQPRPPFNGDGRARNFQHVPDSSRAERGIININKTQRRSSVNGDGSTYVNKPTIVNRFGGGGGGAINNNVDQHRSPFNGDGRARNFQHVPDSSRAERGTININKTQRRLSFNGDGSTYVNKPSIVNRFGGGGGGGDINTNVVQHRPPSNDDVSARSVQLVHNSNRAEKGTINTNKTQRLSSFNGDGTTNVNKPTSVNRFGGGGGCDGGAINTNVAQHRSPFNGGGGARSVQPVRGGDRAERGTINRNKAQRRLSFNGDSRSKADLFASDITRGGVINSDKARRCSSVNGDGGRLARSHLSRSGAPALSNTIGSSRPFGRGSGLGASTHTHNVKIHSSCDGDGRDSDVAPCHPIGKERRSVSIDTGTASSPPLHASPSPGKSIEDKVSKRLDQRKTGTTGGNEGKERGRTNAARPKERGSQHKQSTRNSATVSDKEAPVVGTGRRQGSSISPKKKAQVSIRACSQTRFIIVVGVVAGAVISLTVGVILLGRTDKEEAGVSLELENENGMSFFSPFFGNSGRMPSLWCLTPHCMPRILWMCRYISYIRPT